VANVAHGLGLGFEHGATVGVGAAGGAGVGQGEGELGQGVGIVRRGIGAGVGGLLLGFEGEAGAAVEIDVAGGDATIGVAERDGALENVGVARAVGAGGVGAGDYEQVAELGEKKILVGAFGTLGAVPAGELGFNGIEGHASPPAKWA